MIAFSHGLDTDMTSLRRRFPVSIKGATLEDLIATAALGELQVVGTWGSASQRKPDLVGCRYREDLLKGSLNPRIKHTVMSFPPSRLR